MTVLEPMPDRRSGRSRASLLRRTAFLATAVSLVIAFGATLSGIATTQGTVRPDGEAAAIAARQARTTSHRGGDCPRHRRQTQQRSASGRV
jgi:hypothetical protein